jgi:hypothetical protein
MTVTGQSDCELNGLEYFSVCSMFLTVQSANGDYHDEDESFCIVQFCVANRLWLA